MNDTNTIIRRIEIDAAHRVPHHASKCFNVHGHRYVIEAVCEGPIISDGHQRGMVMDFGFLKTCMMQAIYDPCDHGSIFYYEDDVLYDILGPEWDFEAKHTYPLRVVPECWKLYIIDRVPTAENLAAIWFVELTRAIELWFKEHEPHLAIPQLREVRVHETPNCVAIYRKA